MRTKRKHKLKSSEVGKGSSTTSEHRSKFDTGMIVLLGALMPKNMVRPIYVRGSRYIE